MVDNTIHRIKTKKLTNEEAQGLLKYTKAIKENQQIQFDYKVA